MCAVRKLAISPMKLAPVSSWALHFTPFTFNRRSGAKHSLSFAFILVDWTMVNFATYATPTHFTFTLRSPIHAYCFFFHWEFSFVLNVYTIRRIMSAFTLNTKPTTTRCINSPRALVCRGKLHFFWVNSPPRHWIALWQAAWLSHSFYLFCPRCLYIQRTFPFTSSSFPRVSRLSTFWITSDNDWQVHDVAYIWIFTFCCFPVFLFKCSSISLFRTQLHFKNGSPAIFTNILGSRNDFRLASLVSGAKSALSNSAMNFPIKI